MTAVLIAFWAVVMLAWPGWLIWRLAGPRGLAWPLQIAPAFAISLAIISALIVECAGDRFAIPQLAVW